MFNRTVHHRFDFTIDFRGRVDELTFFQYLSPFCFLSIEFHCTFSISYKILPYFVYCYSILIRLWYAVGTSHFTFFHTLSSLLSVFVCSIVLFQSCCSHARVFGKTLLHEFPLFYSHTEWYFISIFGAKEFKHAQRTLL